MQADMPPAPDRAARPPSAAASAWSWIRAQFRHQCQCECETIPEWDLCGPCRCGTLILCHQQMRDLSAVSDRETDPQ
jgi:hypothetical protein